MRTLQSFVLSLAQAASALADTPREEIARLLSGMEAAVLAGDLEGYLAHVDRADPVFFMEQKNWAADLERHLPVEIDWTLGEEGEFEADRARVPLACSWRLEAWEKARTVEFRAVFVRRAEADAGANPWLYAGEDWEAFEGERIKVFFPAGRDELARRVADAFPEVRAHVEDGFQLRVDRVQEVKLYPTMRHLQHSIYLSYTDGLGGWNEPGESIKLLAGGLNERGLRPLLAHEFGHVATFEMGEKANSMAWWILEGVAELSSESFARGRRGTDRAVRAWAKADRLADWQDLSDFHDFPQELMGHVYTQGHHMLGYISDRFGREGRNAWLRAMALGSTLDEATTAALGRSFEELDREWRESLSGADEPDERPDDAPAEDPK